MSLPKKHNYQSINSPVLVPKLDLTVEDLLISISPAMMGNGISGICSYVSEAISVFVGITGVVGSVALLIFARKRRREEIRQRGYCRSSILRRYLTYLMGADWLRCR